MSALRQPLRLWTRLGPTLGALCLACEGGQTGGEYQGTVTDSACGQTIRELALDDAGPLGFSGADVLAGVLGTHGSPLFWNADTTPVAIGPEQGESSIEISIEHSGSSGGGVRYVDLEPSRADAVPSGATAAPSCEDRLELPVFVRLSTGGGALAEQFAATLVASSADSAALSYVLVAEDVSGSFAVSAPAPASAATVFVDVKWDEQGFRGTLSGQLVEERRETASSSARLIIYAAWPEPRANVSP
jgi:hypothetical protein